MRRKVKINHDYFSLTSSWQNIFYFLRQGHILNHIIDRIKWYYFPNNFIVPSFPMHLEVESSSTCQMRCPMCKTTEMANKGLTQYFGIMDLELYKKIIDECAITSSLYSIKLSWRGEPLLNPYIVEMVAYAKKRGIKDVAFLTNGERFNPQLVEALVNAGLDWVSISVDGLADVYNQVRKPAIYQETIDKIKSICSCRIKTKRKKPLIRIQSVHSAIRGQEDEFLWIWEKIADRINFIADQKRSINIKDYRLDPNYICPSPWQRMCISWDGKVVQCHSDYLEGNVLGDVKEKSISEIWHDKPFNELRQLMKNGQRLLTAPCRICSDGGITKQEQVIIGNRIIKAAHYVEQGIDVREMIAEEGNNEA